MHLVAIPAYGRDYASVAELEKSIADGKDFRFWGGSRRYPGVYFSIRDFPRLAEDGATIEFRYDRWNKFHAINPEKFYREHNPDNAQPNNL